MSSRRSSDNTYVTASYVSDQLEQLKADLASHEIAESTSAVNEAHSKNPLGVDQELSGVDKAAKSLGVDSEAWKPIKFMNNAHYKHLVASNALDENLNKRIEAFVRASAA